MKTTNSYEKGAEEISNNFYHRRRSSRKIYESLQKASKKSLSNCGGLNKGVCGKKWVMMKIYQ